MKIDLTNLPTDTAFLHQIVTDLVITNEHLQEINQSLKAQLALLKRKRLGKSSEKLESQIEELEERIEDGETFGLIPVDESESESSNESDDDTTKQDQDNSQPKSKNHPKRKPLPAHLARQEIHLNPDPKCPSCGGESFRKIGEDISEVLEYIPASFRVIKYLRPRCVCTVCKAIVQADPQSKTIDKGLAGPGLLAHILVQKYCNHLPMYRQSEIYAREDIDLPRSTMAGWAGQCARLLEPLVNEIRKSVFASSQIHGDDTTVKVLAPGLFKTKTGRLWVYVRDGRPAGDTTPPAACYFYSPDRKGERPQGHLRDYNFTGTLHADAYGGYDKLYEDGSITEAACFAHARRKFYEVTVAAAKASIATEVLTQIAKIYEIEATIRGKDPDHRYKIRQEQSKDLVDKLFVYLKQSEALIPKKSMTAKAINYALNHKTALMRFLDNGKIEIDNNAAERAMRSIAIGRKNWLFAGSDRGGETAANMYTIMETAKLNNINPWTYLRHVLATIQDHNSQKMDELLPWNVKLEGTV